MDIIYIYIYKEKARLSFYCIESVEKRIFYRADLPRFQNNKTVFVFSKNKANADLNDIVVHLRSLF